MNTTKLETLLQETFADVVERHGLEMIDSREDDLGVQVTLGNQKAAIRVRWEYPDGRFFLTIHRLDRGPVAPLRDLSERRRDPLNGFDVDDLISVRAADRRIDQAELSDHETLKAYAAALQIVADDVFTGDFTIFDQLARIVVQRIQQQAHDNQAIGPDALGFMTAAQEADLL